MDSELKAKWVAALRSGEYEQGKRYLKRENKYCCLGVLTVLLGVDADADLTGQPDSKPYEPVRKVIGNRLNTLVNLNDYEDQTFLEIADYIEAHL